MLVLWGEVLKVLRVKKKDKKKKKKCEWVDVWIRESEYRWKLNWSNWVQDVYWKVSLNEFE